MPAGLERAEIGPIRKRQGAWLRTHGLLAAEPSPAHQFVAGQGFVVARGHLRSLGIGEPEIRRQLRARRWSTPRRGVVSLLAPRPTAAVGERFSDRARTYGNDAEVIAAATALLHPGSVVSHLSAAAMHGLPTVTAATRATLTIANPGRECGRQRTRVHVAALAEQDLASWFGIPVTSIARTVSDLARTVGMPDALVAADGALHERLVTQRELSLAVSGAAGWPGVTSARLVAGFADGLAESPLESLTRLCLHRGQVPPPELQVPIVAGGRRFRVDFAWRAQRVVLEADGLAKYASPDRLREEKRRQELIERAGYRVVRVGWDDVMNHPTETVARVLRALGTPYGPR